MREYWEKVDQGFPTLNEQLEKEEFFKKDPTYGMPPEFFQRI